VAARMKRQIKSPKQRAEEALDLATRQEKRLADKAAAARRVFEEAHAAHEASIRRLRHAESNPDLRDEDDTELPFDQEKP
jgi:hypothetical protein